MFCGIFSGFIFRKKKSFITFADKSAGWSIYILLFLLGLSVGNNKEVINNFTNIGFNSIIITLSGVSGSIILSFIIYKIFFKNNESL